VARRDAAQPWTLWLLFRVLLALVVLAAAGWSSLLITRGRGGYWPWVAVGAGALSLLLIALDIRARRRQRAALRVPTVPRVPAAPPRQYRGVHHADGAQAGTSDRPTPAFVPEPPPRPDPASPPGRHSHRR